MIHRVKVSRQCMNLLFHPVNDTVTDHGAISYICIHIYIIQLLQLCFSNVQWDEFFSNHCVNLGGVFRNQGDYACCSWDTRPQISPRTERAPKWNSFKNVSRGPKSSSTDQFKCKVLTFFLLLICQISLSIKDLFPFILIFAPDFDTFAGKIRRQASAVTNRHRITEHRANINFLTSRVQKQQPLRGSQTREREECQIQPDSNIFPRVTFCDDLSDIKWN